jgi:phospholipid-binding lipoprotein MlaA
MRIVNDTVLSSRPLAEPPEAIVNSARPLRVAVQWAGSMVLLAAALTGCADQPRDPVERAAAEQPSDPLEPVNRRILDFNDVVDTILLRPVAKAYVFVVPEDGRAALRRVLDNMKEPTLFFNNMLQGEFARAGITAGRFVINTAFGIGGLVDLATPSGLKRQPADFGQTLFVWGLPSGPYLVLPIMGPTNARDAIGGGVDSYADPFTILANARGVAELTIARFPADGIDQRASVLDVLDDLKKNAVDYYAELRSMSQQHRAAELSRAEAPAAAPSLYTDPGSAPPSTAQPTPAH